MDSMFFYEIIGVSFHDNFYTIRKYSKKTNELVEEFPSGCHTVWKNNQYIFVDDVLDLEILFNGDDAKFNV